MRSLATLLLASQASAHMILASPVPFGSPDNSPLSSTGDNFPCQIVGTAATFYDRSAATNNTMAVGAPQTLSFTGSAVHGGGSCQLAVTADLQPTNATTWQVIESIEGGCPTTDGNGASTYSYTIPAAITPGDYVFAWTWISKESGAPEYYMNCAPITVTAASSKREAARAQTVAARDTLPNLFVANLDSINTCKTTTGTDPLYPDPGPTVLQPSEMTTNYEAPSGTDCYPLGYTDASANSTTASGSGSLSASASVAVSTVSTASVSTASISTSATEAASTFSTTVAEAAATSSAATTSAATSTPATPATSSTTVAAATTTGTSSGTANSTGLTGTCTEEGEFNCVGGTEYQQCASGTWTTLQAMPAGTKCEEGESTTLWARDRRTHRQARRWSVRWTRRGRQMY